MKESRRGSNKVKVAVIIPAYNEEKTIAGVVSVLLESPLVDQVIVVSDGSTDNTVGAVMPFPEVQIIELLENRGKGGAIKAGLEHTRADVLLFLDADLIGLSARHIALLLEPVLAEKAVMSVGLFKNGRAATDLAQKVVPFLSGQRAVRRELLEQVADLDLSRFGVETALHMLVEEKQINVQEVILPGLSHMMKEEKMGFCRGVAARFKMYWEIICYAWRRTASDHGK